MFRHQRYIKKCTLYYHMRQHVPDKFVCLECGHLSDDFDQSTAHKKEHDEKKHFVCSKCNQLFLRRQQYLSHLKVCHFKKVISYSKLFFQRHNLYKCLTCDESYASRSNVVRHKQMGHDIQGLQPRFICPHCPLAFHRTRLFNLHIKKHTGRWRSKNK